MLIDEILRLFSDTVSPYRRRYKASESIFRQGDHVQGIFAVEEGQVRLERYTSEGRSAIMHIARPNESFAEAALFSDTYHCDATAVRPSHVVLFPKADVLKTLQNNPQTSLKYIALLSEQVRTLRTRIELRSILSARERILQYLLLYVDPKTRLVLLSGTLKDLAAELGLAPETLYREMKNLEDKGLIERDDNAAVVRVTV